MDATSPLSKQCLKWLRVRRVLLYAAWAGETMHVCMRCLLLLLCVTLATPHGVGVRVLSAGRSGERLPSTNNESYLRSLLLILFAFATNNFTYFTLTNAHSPRPSLESTNVLHIPASQDFSWFLFQWQLIPNQTRLVSMRRQAINENKENT